MFTPAFVGRFGAFSLDVGQFELRRNGRTVKLERQAMELLILLVERHGQLVLRPEIVSRLWGDAVFVDVDTGVNTAISKIRQALRDSAQAPTFIETVQGRGYRFIATVDNLSAPPITTTTIAVLPFENLTSVPECEYLAAGLTEETSASLAQIDPAHLTVKGRTLRYQGTTKTVTEIGHELSVDYLVAGSIRVEGIRLRLTVALIRVSDQEHVWSQSYDREATSLLGLQQDLSAAIARQIRLCLSPDRINGVGRRQTRNADAYDVYLRGRFQAHRRTADGNARAIALFKRAIEIDPSYALAWADLASTYAGACINGDADPAEAGPRAREAALRAVEANGNLSEAQLALGYGLWMIDWKWQASEAALQLAVDIDPSNAAAYRILGHVLSQSGQHEEAATAMRRSCELDPLDALSRALSSQVAFQGRDLAGAGDHARHAIALDPSLWIGHIELAQAYDGIDDHELALQAVADAVRLSGGNSKAVALRGYVLARMGRLDAVREVMRGLETRSNERYVPPYAMALVCAGLGDREPMFDFLDKALAAHDVHLMYLPVDMKWDPYRTDRRFGDLLLRCGFTTSP
jgi:TolB-like protein/Tfp pilus assembly protein PilF